MIVNKANSVKYPAVSLRTKYQIENGTMNWNEYFTDNMGREVSPSSADVPKIEKILNNITTWYKRGILLYYGFNHIADYLLHSLWVEMKRTNNYRPNKQMVGQIVKVLESMPKEKQKAEHNFLNALEIGKKILEEIRNRDKEKV